jgi:hypothetical protein
MKNFKDMTDEELKEALLTGYRAALKDFDEVFEASTAPAGFTMIGDRKAQVCIEIDTDEDQWVGDEE